MPSPAQKRTARLLRVDPKTIDPQLHHEAVKAVRAKSYIAYNAMSHCCPNQMLDNIPYMTAVAVTYQFLIDNPPFSQKKKYNIVLL